MLYYYSPVFKDATVYSVDMLRLQLDFSSNKGISDFNNYILSLSESIVERFPPSYKAYGYRNLYKLRCSNGNGFIIGLHFNGSCEDGKYLGFMEFNPNKVALENEFQEVYFMLNEHCLCADIVRWDLAVDVSVRRDLCKFSLDNYDGSYHLRENSNLDKTEYLRKRNRNGFVKLYNKQKESGLDYELTRLEITVGGKKSYEDFCKVCPKVIIKGDGNKHNFYNELKNKSDIVLLELLMSLDILERNQYFEKLSYCKKSKLRQYINNVYGSSDKFIVSEEIFNQLKQQLREWTIGIKYTLLDDWKEYK